MSTYSNWREDLIEVIDTPTTEAKALRKVKETKVKNKVVINPKLDEAVKELGGELLEVKEVDDKSGTGEDPQIKSKEKRQAMIKRQVLLKKLQAVRAGGGADITAGYEPEGEIIEAKVDKGRSDYGKASIRNYRRSGPDTLEPAMFDPDNKRGKTIDKRREEHKARRGVKKAKVPTYTKEETVDEAKSAAWQRKEGKRESGGLNQKGVDSYRAANPGSKLKTAVTTKPSKLKKGSKSASRRKSFCARMGGMKKKLTSAKTANDPDSRINKSLRKWNCSYEPDGTPIMEADKAFNTVLAALQKKHGKENIITKKNPMKPQSAADKAKARAHQAKVDKENAAERKKDPSQGRYPKG